MRHDGGGGLARQRRGGAAGGVDALLLLPAVAEPDADHLLLHVELLGHEQDLLRGRLLVLEWGDEADEGRSKTYILLIYLMSSASICCVESCQDEDDASTLGIQIID